MAKSEIICGFCGKTFFRENKQINLNRKNGSINYCSLSCSANGLHKRGVFDHLKTGVSPEARERQLERLRLWYQNNKQKCFDKEKKRRIKRRQFIDSQKTSCKMCGESNSTCLDFHHRNPQEKAICIGSSITSGYSIERIKKEILKCDVLCANCHRKLHAEERKEQTSETENEQHRCLQKS